MLSQGAYNGPMWARRILGLVLVAMGVGKLSDPSGYATALLAFRVIPAGAVHSVAWVWLAAELLAGALLLAKKGRAGGMLAIAINVAYAALTTQAYARHLAVDNCTCFGVHLRQRLSWFVLAQDAYMVALSVYVFVVARRSTRRARAESPAR